MAATPVQMPVGLQLRSHRATGEQYWAAVAVGTIHSSQVGVMQEYSSAWQLPRPGSVPVSFMDELAASTGSATVDAHLRDYRVHVTQAWLEGCFRTPTWQEFVASNCRKLGVTVGIMSGLLPTDGVPVSVVKGGGAGAGGAVRRKGGAAAGGGAGGAGGAAALGVAVSRGGRVSRLSILRSALPVVLVNVAIGLLVWALARYVEHSGAWKRSRK